MSKGSLKVEINPEGFVKVSNGLFNKNISIKDFSSVVSSMLSELNEDPSGVSFRYPSSIHSVTKVSGGYFVNLYYEGKEADIIHNSLRGPKTIYLPNVMIRVELRDIKGKPGSFSLGDIYWYATDKSRIALPTEWPKGGCSQNHIWTLPLPNIYSNAKMCTGGNRLPSVVYQDWTVLDMLYNDVLIKSAFNNDLNINGLARTSGTTTPSEWVQELHAHWKNKDTSEFPYDKLINY